MKNIQEYIQSGVIELYAFGLASDSENAEVEAMAAGHELVRDAIDMLTRQIEESAQANAVQPPASIKPMLLATVNYMERMENGEIPSDPPELNEFSQIADYAQWLKKPDMILPSFVTDLHARIIGHSARIITAIVWIIKMAPEEVHDNEYEKFLIVEGSCSITIDEQIYMLQAGDYMSIPLYKNHLVQVTSAIPCKAILQRVAA